MKKTISLILTVLLLAGDKTPEETAKLIQSKLSIYLAEQG